MIKLYASAIFGLIAFSLCTAPSPKNKSLKAFDLNGKVKSVKINEYDSKDLIGKPDRATSFECMLFNENGNIIEKFVIEKEDSTKYRRHEYEYNSDGLCIKEKKLTSAGELKFETVFSYDSEGNCIEQIIYKFRKGEKGAYRTLRKKYDANGRLTKDELFHWDKKEPNTRSLYEYDANGNQTKRTRIKTRTNRMTIWEKEYDDKNREIKEIRYSKGDSTKSISEDIRDELGRVKEHRVYRENGSLWITRNYQYDVHNNVVQQDFAFVKNDSANVEKIWHKEIYTYEFDGISNWIRKTRTHTFEDIENFYCIERKIEYY